MSTEAEFGAEKIGLAFRNLNVSTGSRNLLFNVNGYVARGGMTAVMGASACGKSVLLQTLAGRMQDLHVSGDVFMKGKKVNPKATDNPIAYVPQEDSLQGELSAREVTLNTALLKRNEPKEQLEKEVADLLDQLGLTHVADGIIGTLIFRGLSGGQKKRAEVCCELIASPAILLLDEPTSGLDSTISYEVLHTIRELAKKSNGRLSVIFSIHQPNSRILSLFDHLLLLERGASIYFGTVPGAIQYFSSIGFPCPAGVTPTDYFLQISDSNFRAVMTQQSAGSDAAGSTQFDFEESFSRSGECSEVQALLDQHKALCEGGKLVVEDSAKMAEGAAGAASTAGGKRAVPFWYQVWVLVYREFALAFRDPTLYYFQVTMLMIFAFMAGAVFWRLPRNVNVNFNIFLSAMLWITLFHCWVHIFKVYYINGIDKRTTHELANNKYTHAAWIVSDIISTSLLTVLFFGTPAIAYFMFDFPAKAYPFIILCCWVTSLCAEAMIALICKFSKNATTNMIFSQIALVNLEIFGGGVFLAWKDCPDYWVWIQESNLFTHSSRAMIMEVMNHMYFKCDLQGGKCYGTDGPLKCDSYAADGQSCQVWGRELLYQTQGIGTGDSYWKYFGILIAIGAAFKLLVCFLTYYPWERITYWVMNHNQKGKAELEAHLIEERSNRRKKQDGNDYSAVNKSGDAADAAEAGEKPEMRTLKSKQSYKMSKACLTWSHLTVSLPKTGAKLVDDCSGFVRAGRILALMGPSGAGKTTLLNGLANRASYARIDGKVQFAGRKMTSTDLTYVPQFDHVNGALTVYEHLTLVGHLTCLDKKAMLDRAELLLNVLGLAEKRNTAVKDLSGGEVKRVSVGIGMISNPYVLFLDEPTTGLDSTAAYSIVKYLVQIASATNVAIIMTIHQPSALVFSMLDDLMLLENGHTAYAGSIADAKEYFASVGYSNPESINPADYYLDIVQTDAQWKDKFAKSSNSVTFANQLCDILAANETQEPAAQPSMLSRFSTMFTHFMVYFFQERGIYIHRALALIVIAVFMGSLFLRLDPTTSNLNSYMGAMFGTAIAVILTAVSSTYIFAKNRREAVERIANGIYTPGVFVASQFLASAIYNWLVSFLFVSIFHWIVDLCPANDCFVFDIFISWAHLMLMEAVIQCCVEGLKNDFLATTAGLIFIGQNMMFSGFFRPVSSEPPAIQWLFYVFPLKWSFGAFSWKIFTTIGEFTVPGSDMKLSGEYILNNYFRLYDIHAWGMFGAMLGYVLFFRFNQYFLMAVQTGCIKLPLPSFLSGSGGSSREVTPSPSSKSAAIGGHAPLPTSEENGVQMTEFGAV